MPQILPSKVISEARQIVMFSWSDIKNILVEKANELTNLQHTEFIVTHEDETEGSPPYRVGTKVRVELIKKM